LGSYIQQLYEGFIHPSINCEDLHPKIEERISENKIPQKLLNIAPQIIISSSFGFGDINCCIAFKKYVNGKRANSGETF
jgi:3-oxoacyl-(acyl-carrier-protein) synthase